MPTDAATGALLAGALLSATESSREHAWAEWLEQHWLSAGSAAQSGLRHRVQPALIETNAGRTGRIVVALIPVPSDEFFGALLAVTKPTPAVQVAPVPPKFPPV